MPEILARAICDMDNKVLSKEDETILIERKKDLERVRETLTQPMKKPNRINDFMSRETDGNQEQELESLENIFVGFVSLLDAKLPENRAKSVAFTNLETVYMWAIKAIKYK